ncbi:MAG: hypothetical protein IPJ54_11205 [Saprospiraceae bacterium]|nr:hypothetical protein [Saprospiraceae bacterium]
MRKRWGRGAMKAQLRKYTSEYKDLDGETIEEIPLYFNSFLKDGIPSNAVVEFDSDRSAVVTSIYYWKKRSEEYNQRIAASEKAKENIEQQDLCKI